jgi:hypothetical protein
MSKDVGTRMATLAQRRPAHAEGLGLGGVGRSWRGAARGRRSGNAGPRLGVMGHD